MEIPESALPMFSPGGPFEGIDPADVRSLGRFLVITVTTADGEGRVAVQPAVGPDGSEPPFEAWMTAAEYMVACAARRSNAGFERAVELLSRGAMTYRPFTPDPNWKPPPPPEG